MLMVLFSIPRSEELPRLYFILPSAGLAQPLQHALRVDRLLLSGAHVLQHGLTFHAAEDERVAGGRAIGRAELRFQAAITGSNQRADARVPQPGAQGERFVAMGERRIGDV